MYLSESCSSDRSREAYTAARLRMPIRQLIWINGRVWQVGLKGYDTPILIRAQTDFTWVGE